MNDAAPPAFAELVVATEAALRLSIAARGIPLSEVDDIAQDVYLEYHRDHARRPAEVEPLRWLKGIARHHCLRWFRRRARASRRLARVAAALERARTPFEDDDPADLVARLRRCLERLPERSRRLLAGYDGEDGGVDRAASGVRMAVLRLRQALRDCILADGAEGGA